MRKLPGKLRTNKPTHTITRMRTINIERALPVETRCFQARCFQTPCFKTRCP